MGVIPAIRSGSGSTVSRSNLLGRSTLDLTQYKKRLLMAVFLFAVLIDDFIDQSVFQCLLWIHEIITICIYLNCFHGLFCVFCENAI